MFARSEKIGTKIRWMRVALVLSVGMAWLAQNSYLDTPIRIVKNISVPFPCQFSGCGCKDAVQCWSSCGCHTDAEKIAWAKKNSVQPPKWFLEDLNTKLADSDSTETCEGCCCCSKKPKQPPAKVASDQNNSTHVVYLNLSQRRKCNGQYDTDMVTWYFVAPSDQPLPPAYISPVVLAAPPSPLAVTLRPPTPPPKHVFNLRSFNSRSVFV